MADRTKIFSHLRIALISACAILAILIGWDFYKEASYCWESTPEGHTVNAEHIVMLAIIDYYSDHGKMPKAEGKALIAILCGKNEYGLNPESRYYLKIAYNDLKDGLVVDGWGKPLVIHLDYVRDELLISSSRKNMPIAFHSFKKMP